MVMVIDPANESKLPELGPCMRRFISLLKTKYGDLLTPELLKSVIALTGCVVSLRLWQPPNGVALTAHGVVLPPRSWSVGIT